MQTLSPSVKKLFLQQENNAVTRTTFWHLPQWRGHYTAKVVQVMNHSGNTSCSIISFSGLEIVVYMCRILTKLRHAAESNRSANYHSLRIVLKFCRRKTWRTDRHHQRLCLRLCNSLPPDITICRHSPESSNNWKRCCFNVHYTVMFDHVTLTYFSAAKCSRSFSFDLRYYNNTCF